jgi:hypothetical protein
MRSWRSLGAVVWVFVFASCGDDDASVDGGVDAGVDAGVDSGSDAAPPDGGSDAGSSDAPVTVSLTIEPDTVFEAPASDVSFVLSLDREPPPGGTRVYVLGDVPQSLSQLNLFGIRTAPASNDAPVGDLDFSGFTLLLEAREVTVRIRGFDDSTAEEPLDVTYRIVPFDEVPWGELAIENEMAAGAYVVGGDPQTLRFQDAP